MGDVVNPILALRLDDPGLANWGRVDWYIIHTHRTFETEGQCIHLSCTYAVVRRPTPQKCKYIYVVQRGQQQLSLVHQVLCSLPHLPAFKLQRDAGLRTHERRIITTGSCVGRSHRLYCRQSIDSTQNSNIWISTIRLEYSL